MATGFSIRNLSGDTTVQAFVTKFTNANGDDSWYAVPTNYNNPSTSFWNRGPGWEAVAFENSGGTRRGWYLYVPSGQVCQLTFYGFGRDIGLEYVNA